MQPLLPTFDQSDQDMVDIAMAVPFSQKVDKLISTLEYYRPQISRNSGGKDSAIIEWGMKRAGLDYRSTYSNTTIDAPEVVDHLKTHYPHTEWMESGRGHLILDRMVEKMNMPTRRGKWCCDEYKNCCSGKSCSMSMKCVGVRISESKRRAGLWKTLTTIQATGEKILAPIAYWTDDDVWKLIRGEGLPYCSLYDEGWDRIGCVGCPIPGEARQRKEFARWPEYEVMWREGARRCWERGQTVTNRSGEKYYVAKFGSPDALFDWWLTGKKEKVDTNCVFEEMMEGSEGIPNVTYDFPGS